MQPGLPIIGRLRYSCRCGRLKEKMVGNNHPNTQPTTPHPPPPPHPPNKHTPQHPPPPHHQPTASPLPPNQPPPHPPPPPPPPPARSRPVDLHGDAVVVMDGRTFRILEVLPTWSACCDRVTSRLAIQPITPEGLIKRLGYRFFYG